MRGLAVGVDIGGTNVRLGLVDREGRVTARARARTDAGRGRDKVISKVADAVERLVRDAGVSPGRLAGVGVGVPGIISMPHGVVRFSPNLPGWRDVPLREMLSERLGMGVQVENDANAYALGEARFGAGRGAGSLVCLTLGTGVGGGIILDGRVWRGADGMAGEVGHMTVSPGGRACPCGNRGCLERYSSATAVVERTLEAIGRGAMDTGLSAGGPLTAESIMRAALGGDRLAVKVYMDAGRYLGIAVANLINLLNVERVVVGGGMAGAWELLSGPMRDEVKNRAFDIPAGRCEILPGILGDDAAIIGAAGLVLDKGRG